VVLSFSPSVCHFGWSHQTEQISHQTCREFEAPKSERDGTNRSIEGVPAKIQSDTCKIAGETEGGTILIEICSTVRKSDDVVAFPSKKVT